MIPDGSIVSYAGRWTQKTFHLPFAGVNETTADVFQRLTAAGLAVRRSSTSGGAFGGNFDIAVDLQVENGLGFDKPDDVVSIIRGAVYAVTGDYPLADSIPYVQVPGGSAVSTGQPTGGTPGGTAPAGCISGSGVDTTGSWSLSCWFSNLTQKGLASFGLLAAVALIGIGIFIFSGIRRTSAS